MRKFTRSPWLTALLLLLVGITYSLLALSLSGQGDITWGGDPTIFFWNTLPVLLMLFFLWLAKIILGVNVELPAVRPHRRRY